LDVGFLQMTCHTRAIRIVSNPGADNGLAQHTCSYILYPCSETKSHSNGLVAATKT
jgi:hypothetical protein